jgi:hypothetical protein
MGLGSRLGKMAQSILGSGERTKHMAKVDLSMLTEMSMMATGQMIRLTEWALTNMLMGLCTKVSGGTIFNTVKALRRGRIIADTMELTSMAANMVLARTSGPMEANTLVTGSKTKSVVLGFTLGWTADVLMANGSRITWRATVFTSGVMVALTRANTERIRSMGSAFTIG